MSSLVPINISKIVIDQATINHVSKVLKSGQLSWGKNVATLESNLANMCQTKHATLVSSGTSALHTALMVHGIGPGDEVITTPFTYVATANAIILTGATPVFVDIDPISFNINPNLIESAITKKTKAVLPVDLYGLPADYSKINKIAKKYNLTVIADSAQSFGSTYHDKPSGSLASISCFSLYATKNLMAGEGGFLTTNSKRLNQKIRQFRNHGEADGLDYQYKSIGHNYCPTEVTAAIALGQLKKFSLLSKKRQQIANQLTKAFSNITGLITPNTPTNSTHAFHQYTIRLTKDYPLSRDHFTSFLKSKGIGSKVYYPKSLHRLTHLKPFIRSKNLTHADQASRQVISIPVHPHLTNKQVDYIISSILSIK